MSSPPSHPKVILHNADLLKASGSSRSSYSSTKNYHYPNLSKIKKSSVTLSKHADVPSKAGRYFQDLEIHSASSETAPLIDQNTGSSYYDDVESRTNDAFYYPPLRFDDSGLGSSSTTKLIRSERFDHEPKKMLVEPEKKTTNMQTLMHILKGNIGTGILAMPNAFMNSGLYVGLITLPFLAILSTHCMHMLVKSNRILSRRLGVGMLEYQEVTSLSISIGPRCLRRYSHLASNLIKLFLLITQFGFCCVYAFFVAENIAKFMEATTNPDLDEDQKKTLPKILLGALLPLLILLSFVKSLAHLSIASSMANLFQTVGLIIVLVNLVQDLPPTSAVKPWGDLKTFPLFMGTAIYAFEGIGLVLPLQKEMQEPKALGGAVGVLNTGMVVVMCLNVAIGFFGYLKFGDKVQGSITLNLPDNALYQSCQIIFALAIFLSYAIQYYVPFNIIWPWFRSMLGLKEGTTRTNLAEYGFRALTVIFTVILAAIVPKLDLLISLVGALSSSALALIFPPLIDTCARWDEEKGFWTWTWIFSKNIFICLVGLIGFTTGTYASVENIIASFNDPNQ